jgi:hypothetical protein
MEGERQKANAQRNCKPPPKTLRNGLKRLTDMSVLLRMMKGLAAASAALSGNAGNVR